ncbi:PTS sugar transporter subunit IIA [Absicoccus porci]|uniref:PTS sugar transporter subunit IIA n=1 Tax=Absicoccus porci TaxID=2486576 RepID=UPI0029433AA2|nr:PTS sugar transporter subunit IIA [Absicoccus porci]
MYFDKDLCLFNLKVNTQKQLFEEMDKMLLDNGCVKDTFLDGITQREAKYPTGILFEGTGFAIPHTDSKHVIQSQICFASLNKPILFHDMTDMKKTISVELVFMLAMSQPHEQVETLQNLMMLFQDKKSVQELKKCKSIEKFNEILNYMNIE